MEKRITRIRADCFKRIRSNPGNPFHPFGYPVLVLIHMRPTVQLENEWNGLERIDKVKNLEDALHLEKVNFKGTIYEGKFDRKWYVLKTVSK